MPTTDRPTFTLRPGCHLYLGTDGEWRTAAPGDRFSRVRGPGEVLAAVQRRLADPSGPAATTPVGGADDLLDLLLERDLAAPEPARAQPAGCVVIEGENPVADALAELLAADTPVRTSAAPVPVGDLPAGSVLAACAGWLPDRRWTELDHDLQVAGIAWHRCHVEGPAIAVGPFTLPGATAGYVDTRSRRLAASGTPDELADLWRHLERGTTPPVPWPDAAGAAFVAAAMAIDIRAHLADDPLPSAGHQLVVDPTTLSIDRHPVLPLPHFRRG